MTLICFSLHRQGKQCKQHDVLSVIDAMMQIPGCHVGNRKYNGAHKQLYDLYAHEQQ